MRLQATAVHGFDGQSRLGRFRKLDVGNAPIFEHPNFLDGAEGSEAFSKLFLCDILPAHDEDSRVWRTVGLRRIAFISGPLLVVILGSSVGCLHHESYN
jgi:hypothetical protein